jgi:hypothetical protein
VNQPQIQEGRSGSAGLDADLSRNLVYWLSFPELRHIGGRFSNPKSRSNPAGVADVLRKPNQWPVCQRIIQVIQVIHEYS